MIRTILTSIVFCLAAATAQAGTITAINLLTDYPAGTPLDVPPGAMSTELTVRVENVAGPNPPADFLSGYMVSLRIIPQGGSTGTLTFATPATGTATEPANYVFASTGNFGLQATNDPPNTDLVFFDFNDPYTGGVDVPTAPGSNLLGITFTASPGASGLFDIVALPGAANSEWTDAATPTQQGRAFGNVPIGGGSVVIGQVRVIPEPAGAVLAVFVVGISGCLRLRRSSRRKW